MSQTESPASHHANAARHHRQAASRHLEASHHFKIGKDYAHAAHQAMSARGHELWAQSHARRADRNGARNGAPNESAGSATVIPHAATSAAEHHAQAAHHNEQAARRHGAAEEFSERGEHHRVAEMSRAAREHAQWSIFHGDEAAMLHVEYGGNGRPGGEIA